MLFTQVMVFYLKTQSWRLRLRKTTLAVDKKENAKVDPDNKDHIGAPLQRLLSKVLVKKGQKVKNNEPLFLIEAMKMETTVTAHKPGKIARITLKDGDMVQANDLILEIES